MTAPLLQNQEQQVRLSTVQDSQSQQKRQMGGNAVDESKHYFKGEARLVSEESITTTSSSQTTISANNKERNSVVLPGLSERVVFRRLQTTLEQRQSQPRPAWQLLEVRKHRILTEGSSSSTTNASEPAPTAHDWDGGDAILQALRAYNNNHNEGTTEPLSSLTPPLTATMTCRIPLVSSKACQTKTYTILAVVAGAAAMDANNTTAILNRNNSSGSENNWQRTLLVNCLKWMVDPTATSIIILLPVTLTQALRRNDSYGRRLLAWHEQVDHPVKLVFGTSLWNALEQFQNHQRSPSSSFGTSNSGNSKTPHQRRLTAATLVQQEQVPTNNLASDAILWVSGDQEWRGNRQGLQQGFRLWKRQSAFPVAGSAWEFQYETTNHNNNNTLWNDFTPGSQNSDSVDRSHFYHRSTPKLLLRMRRIHATASRTTAHHVEMNPQQWLPVLVDLTMAAFHHRDYLCFLQHPVLAALREETVNDWESARFGVATWLSLVVPTHVEGSGTHPRRIGSFLRLGSKSDAAVSESSMAWGSLVTDIRFFPIYSDRNETYLTSPTIDEEDQLDGLHNSLPMLLDERKLKVLSLFGGPPSWPNKSVHALSRHTVTEWANDDSCGML